MHVRGPCISARNKIQSLHAEKKSVHNDIVWMAAQKPRHRKPVKISHTWAHRGWPFIPVDTKLCPCRRARTERVPELVCETGYSRKSTHTLKCNNYSLSENTILTTSSDERGAFYGMWRRQHYSLLTGIIASAQKSNLWNRFYAGNISYNIQMSRTHTHAARRALEMCHISGIPSSFMHC